MCDQINIFHKKKKKEAVLAHLKRGNTSYRTIIPFPAGFILPKIIIWPHFRFLFKRLMRLLMQSSFLDKCCKKVCLAI